MSAADMGNNIGNTGSSEIQVAFSAFLKNNVGGTSPTEFRVTDF